MQTSTSVLPTVSKRQETYAFIVSRWLEIVMKHEARVFNNISVAHNDITVEGKILYHARLTPLTRINWRLCRINSGELPQCFSQLLASIHLIRCSKKTPDKHLQLKYYRSSHVRALAVSSFSFQEPIHPLVDQRKEIKCKINTWQLFYRTQMETVFCKEMTSSFGVKRILRDNRVRVEIGNSKC